MSSAPSEIEVETIHSLHHSVNWQKGSRWATGANISGMLKNKEKFDLELRNNWSNILLQRDWLPA